MRKLVLHIGFPKTGSSALQAFLCQNPVLSSGNGKYQYFVVRKGKLLSGQALAWRARLHPLGYLGADCSAGDAVAHLQNADIPAGHIPVLSCESWGHEAQHLPGLSAALKQGEWQAEIIAFIRPQIDWLQSAWWQWYAWEPTKPTPEAVWDQLARSGKCDWAAHLEKFSTLPGISKITVKLFDPQQDIVSTLAGVLDIEHQTKRSRKNLSLSPVHIKLYQLLAGLRQPHLGVLDGIVTRLLPSSQKAPSVISPVLAAEITSAMAARNEKLLGWLCPQEAELMRANKRWWASAAPAGRVEP